MSSVYKKEIKSEIILEFWCINLLLSRCLILPSLIPITQLCAQLNISKVFDYLYFISRSFCLLVLTGYSSQSINQLYTGSVVSINNMYSQQSINNIK